MTSTTPAQAIGTALAAAGVPYLFGMPGGGNNLDVIGACEQRGIEFVLAHTETAAAIMATAYGELTGTVGACVVTRGPGAASAVNGVAQAHQDRQPLLLLCDTVDEQSAPRIAHQAIDQRALFAPVTRWSTTIGTSDPDDVIRAALAVAGSPPRGAVHLDVDPTSARRDPPPATPTESGAMTDVIARLSAARRPLIVAGVGARAHAEAVRALVAGTSVPVMMTYKAKGLVPDSAPNSAGVFTGSKTDGLLIDRADLVLALGLDSIELVPNPWPYEAPVVALSDVPDPHPYFPAAAAVTGPLGKLLAQLPALPDEWAAETAASHRRAIDRALVAGPGPQPGIAPWDVVRAARSHAPAGSVATVDAGAHMLVVMPLWTTERPGEVLISSGLATMGYALPAAIGAALARPAQRVYCFTGDGGLQMCLAELETLARLGLAVTVIVFNDQTLSLIKAKQRPTGHGGAGAVQYRRTDFAAVSEGMGVPARRVDDLAALHVALSDIPHGPQLLDVRVHPDCYPHVIDVVRNGATREARVQNP